MKVINCIKRNLNGLVSFLLLRHSINSAYCTRLWPWMLSGPHQADVIGDSWSPWRPRPSLGWLLPWERIRRDSGIARNPGLLIKTVRKRPPFLIILQYRDLLWGGRAFGLYLNLWENHYIQKCITKPLNALIEGSKNLTWVGWDIKWEFIKRIQECLRSPRGKDAAGS